MQDLIVSALGRSVFYHFKNSVCSIGCWLVGFGFNGPLRQYFSLYWAVSQRGGEREEKGY